MKKMLFVSMVSLALLVTLVVAMQVTAAPDAPLAVIPGTVGVSIVPSYTLATPDETYVYQVWVDPMGNPVVGGKVYLFYDETYFSDWDSDDNGDYLYINGPDCDAGVCFAEFGGTMPAEGDWVMEIELEVDAAALGAKVVPFDRALTQINGTPADTYETILYTDLTVVVPQDQFLTVNIAPAAAEAAGCSVTPSPATPPDYKTGDPVTLTPVDCPCYEFASWTGDPLDGSTDNPASLNMNDDYTVTANFIAPTFTLTVDVVGNGTVTKNPDEAGYDCGTVVALTPVPGASARFLEWSGALTGDTVPGSVTMNGDTSVTATFVDTWNVSEPTPVGGTVTVEDENGDGFYDDGETITITATADDCYDFVDWTDDLAGESNPYITTLSGDLTFDAIFQLRTHTVDVNIQNADGITGSVTLDPATGPYDCGTYVTLTTSFVGTGKFDGWSGDLLGDDDPALLYIDGDKVVTASFVSKVFIDIDLNPPGGTVDLEPDQPVDGYDPGDVVTVTATPDPCYQFDGWIGDVTSTDNPLVVTLDTDLSFTATFSVITYADITVVIDPLGKGTVVLDPATGPYICGVTPITATATATTTWAFASWSGAVVSTDNPVNFMLSDAGSTLTANFMQYTIYLPLVMRNG